MKTSWFLRMLHISGKFIKVPLDKRELNIVSRVIKECSEWGHSPFNMKDFCNLIGGGLTNNSRSSNKTLFLQLEDFSSIELVAASAKGEETDLPIETDVNNPLSSDDHYDNPLN